MPRRLYISSLPFNYREKDVRALFANFGEVTEARLVTNEEGKSKGGAFVTFLTEAEAVEAMGAAHGHEVDGRTLSAEWAKMDADPLVFEAKVAAYDPSKNHVPILPPTLDGTKAREAFVATHVILDGVPTAATEEDVHQLGFLSVEGVQCFWDDVKILRNHSDPPESIGVAYVQCKPELLNTVRDHINCHYDVGKLKLSARLGEGKHRPSEQALQAQAIARSIGKAKDPPGLLEEMLAQVQKVQAKIFKKKAAIEAEKNKVFRMLELGNMVPPGEYDDSLADEVREETEQFGTILEVQSLRDPQRIRITFATHESALNAKAKFHGRWFDGRQVFANLWPAAEDTEPAPKVRKVA